MFQKYVVMCGNIPLYSNIYSRRKAINVVGKMAVLSPSIDWSFRPISRSEIKSQIR